MEFNLADLFESVVDAVGERTALVSGDRRLTYAALDGRADRLAAHLTGRGVGPGDRIGLQLVNGAEYLEAMVACFKVRAVPVNVNYRYVAAELAGLYRDAGLVGLVVHRRFVPAAAGALGSLAATRTVLVVEDGTAGSDGPELPGAEPYEAALAAADGGRRPVDRRADDLYCVYTGGTTGRPKGVLWRHDDIFFAAMGGGDPLAMGDHVTSPEALVGRLPDPGVVALALPPFMHAAGHWLAWSTLFGGGTVVTTTGGGFDPDEVWRLVAAERVNVLAVVGDAMVRPLLDALEAAPDAHDRSSLLAVGSGGAVLSPSTKADLARLLPGCIVADRFGSSETGQVGGQAPAGDPFGPPRLRVDGDTDVLDEHLVPVVPGSGAVGRLARGGHVPLGYLGDPPGSLATFVESGGRRWALPGDLATVEADGTIVVLGRGSLCINTGGEKVFPDEVEAALKGHPDVADALVVGVPDARFGERVVALVRARPGRTPAPRDVADHVRSTLSGYKVPRQVLLVDEVVRSPSGKPDYPWARATAEARAGGPDAA